MEIKKVPDTVIPPQSVSVAFVIAFTDRSSRCKVPLYGFDGLVVSKMLGKRDGLSAKGSR